MNLFDLGWNDYWKNQFLQYQKPNYEAARVASQHKNSYIVYSEKGEKKALVSGRFFHQAQEKDDFPAVGDWVYIEAVDESSSTIHGILPRQSKFSRKSAGEKTEEQIVGTNINTIFLVMGLDQDLNLRRLERYLLLVWESQSQAVIVLSKADLCSNKEEKLAEVNSIAMGVPVLTTSAIEEMGLENLQPFLKRGQTVALLGSSGVGKSTLINKLLGYERQKTQDVRQFKDSGKHTTTYRELILLSEGGLIMDTPGMRELQLWGSQDSLEGTFEDIESLAEECLFRNCQHQGEPGCVIQEALEKEELDESRWQSYQKLQRELHFLDRKKDQKAHLAEKEKWKKITKDYRKRPNKRHL